MTTRHEERPMVWADGTADTEVYWSERHGRWLFVDWLNHLTVEPLESWVEVTLKEGDPDEGLNQIAVACDLEGPGLWVVHRESLETLAGYGDGLVVVSVGTPEGAVLTGEAATEFLSR